MSRSCNAQAIYRMPLSRKDPLPNLSTPLLRDVWALTGIAILIVVLRILAKVRIGKLGPDDLLMVFALVSMTFPWWLDSTPED